MPLAYQGILETLDLETQVAVTSVYLELCKLAGEQGLPPEELERMRHRIARRLLALAQDGERDPTALKEKAGALFVETRDL